MGQYSFDLNVVCPRFLQALRQSDVLIQLTVRWEVPTQAQATRAQKIFDALGIKNISVKMIREPGGNRGQG